MIRSLVSTVMPVYSALPFLKETIKSTSAQTVAASELVAVDDRTIDAS